MDAKSRETEEEELLLGLPFDQYERYALSRAIANVLRKHLNRNQLSVLDVGGAPRVLSRFLADDRALSVDLEEQSGADYMRANGMALPFRDGVFDLVTCHDTLEHVPGDRREHFLLELLRVAADFVIVNGPFSDPRVEEAERLVGEQVRRLLGADHPTLSYLGEHLQFGLPNLDETTAVIERMGLPRVVLPNGAVDEWIVKMVIKHHLLALIPRGVRPQEFDLWSNQSFVPIAIASPSYRHAVIISKRGDQRAIQSVTRDLGQVVAEREERRVSGRWPAIVAAAVEEYSRLLSNTLADKDQHISHVEAQYAARATALDADLSRVSAALAESEELLADVETQLRLTRQQLHAATSSVGFRLLERVRRPINWLAPPETRRRVPLKLLSQAFGIILSEGWVVFLQRTARVWKWAPRLVRSPGSAREAGSLDRQYQKWLEAHTLTAAGLRRARNEAAELAYRPTVSIVMPVYNSDPVWLRQAIESVRAQLYENWELCVADDGSTRPEVQELLQEYDSADERIRVAYLEKNQGIAVASSAALAMANGEFVGFLDHDDELKPEALFEIVKLLNERTDLDFIYSDEDKLDESGNFVSPFFKPDWSPDLLMTMNYVNHFSVIRKALVDRVGGFRPGYDGSQDYDLVLRVTELTDTVAHIAKPLYSWRKVTGSAASVPEAKEFAFKAAKKALTDALARRGLPGDVLDGLVKSTYRVRYSIQSKPKVSIIIPTRDRLDMLSRCVQSIRKKSSYENYEILIVDNESRERDTLEYLASFQGRVIPYPHAFNFASIVNTAARAAEGEVLLFLNNDTEVISPDWIEAMLEHAQRPQVAAVGARLLYPDGRVQHEGIIMGLGGGSAGNVDHGGYFSLGQSVRNCSAVTGACMMVRAAVFWELCGFDERLRVAFNDVDYCLRARQKGLLIVYTPYAVLYHHESASRGRLHPDEDERFFRERWGKPGQYRDPYYNPNLSRTRPFAIDV